MKPAYYRGIFETRFAKMYDLVVSISFLGREHYFREQLISFISSEPKTILDMACGTGSSTKILAEHFNDAKVYGIDLSSAMLKEARKKTSKMHVHFYRQNIEQTSFGNDYFDLITITFALHEIPVRHITAVLKEMKRIIRNKGIIIILDYHLPKNRIQKTLLKIILSLYEPYAKEFLEMDFETLLNQHGLHRIRKKMYSFGMIQMLIIQG